MFKRKLALALLGLTGMGVAGAGEIPNGTLLDASNYESLKNETLNGTRLDDLLTDNLRMAIGKGLPMRLNASWQNPHLPSDIPPDLKAATEKNRGTVQFDSANNMVSGFVAGIPFPDIDVNDPDAGKKLVWNVYLAPPTGYTNYVPVTFALFNMDKGFERSSNWLYYRIYMSGRYDAEQPTLDPQQRYRQILYANYPEDIRGLGTVTYRYTDGRLDDIFAYVKSVRRIRRLSGGAWFDPVGGTDLLQDEPWVLSGFPSWYKDQKLVEKRVMLVPVGDGRNAWNTKSNSRGPEQWPMLQWDKKPYGMPVLQWVPREVYVVQVTPPQEHYYSKKFWYIDGQFPILHMADNYDKSGNYWKLQVLPRNWEDHGNGKIFGPVQGDFTINFKDKHITAATHDADNWKFSDPKQKPEDYMPDVLVEAAKGRR